MSKPAENSKDEQLLRMTLRERFLIATANFNGKKCTFHLYGGQKSEGIFKGADIEFNSILGEKLVDFKPGAVMLRSTDVVSMKFEGIA